MNEVLYQRHGDVAIVTLNRPDALNAFDATQRVAARDAILRAAGDPDAFAVVLTGAGRGFSAGAELKGEMPVGREVGRFLREEYLPGIQALAEMPKPVIAAVSGFAAGIGVGYVLACDLVVMDEGAFMQVPFTRIGLVPDGGLCWQLAERLGHRRAFELAAGGERLAASRCLDWGLANKVVPDGQALPAATEWAEQLAAGPGLALGLCKQLLRRAPGLGFAATLQAETGAQEQCADHVNFSEGVEAFLAKRRPRFSRG